MEDMTNAARYLADNLLALRRQKQFSQQQLAQASGIPRSTITHIESGDGNPSLSNLCKLATALGVTIEELLSRPRDTNTLVKAQDVPVVRKSAGKVRVHKWMPDKVRGIEIDRIELAGRSSMGGHPHVPGSKEYLMCLSGTVLVSLAGGEYEVTAGDVLAFPGDQRHGYRNPGTGTATALSVVLPLPYG